MQSAKVDGRHIPLLFDKKSAKKNQSSCIKNINLSEHINLIKYATEFAHTWIQLVKMIILFLFNENWARNTQDIVPEPYEGGLMDGSHYYSCLSDISYHQPIHSTNWSLISLLAVGSLLSEMPNVVSLLDLHEIIHTQHWQMSYLVEIFSKRC